MRGLVFPGEAAGGGGAGHGAAGAAGGARGAAGAGDAGALPARHLPAGTAGAARGHRARRGVAGDPSSAGTDGAGKPQGLGLCVSGKVPWSLEGNGSFGARSSVGRSCQLLASSHRWSLRVHRVSLAVVKKCDH